MWFWLLVVAAAAAAATICVMNEKYDIYLRFYSVDNNSKMNEPFQPL